MASRRTFGVFHNRPPCGRAVGNSGGLSTNKEFIIMAKANRYQKSKPAKDYEERKKEIAKERRKREEEQKAKWDLIKTKEKVKGLETTNSSRIIVFSSGFPWYKIAFTSVLIYEFAVMPHLSEEANYRVRLDVDGYYKSKNGVISVRNILLFAKHMKKAGFDVPKGLQKYISEDGEIINEKEFTAKEAKEYYSFKIPKMSRAKIKAFRDEQLRDSVERDKQIIPFYYPQELYQNARRLANVIGDMIGRMPRNLCEAYGRDLARMTRLILRDINLTCNGFNFKGGLSYGQALVNAIYRCAEIQETIRILEDNRLLKPSAASIIIDLSLLVQKAAKDEGERLKNPSTGDKIREKIAKAQGFPQLDGLSDMDLPGDIDDGLIYFN